MTLIREHNKIRAKIMARDQRTCAWKDTAIATNEEPARSKKTDPVSAGKAVINASHSSLIIGSKQVKQTELQEGVNPNGLGSQRRLKEKALKDVTNKLETGPVSLKSAWNGLRLGSSSFVKENLLFKNKAQLSKAQLLVEELLIKPRSGPNVGQHARLPDPVSSIDNAATLGSSMFTPKRGAIGAASSRARPVTRVAAWTMIWRRRRRRMDRPAAPATDNLS